MAAQLFLLPFRPAINTSSLVIPGAQLTFYSTGTLIKSPVYTDATMSTALPNPVVANSAGAWPNIYFNTNNIYRVILSDTNGAVLKDVDPYLPSSIDSLSADIVSAIQGLSTIAGPAQAARDQAIIAKDQAVTAKDQASASATLARAYAVSDTNSPINGALATTDRGAKYWADDSRNTRNSFPNYFKGDKGDPGINGGVGSSAGFAALFAAAGGMTIADGITGIITGGHTVPGIGSALYIVDRTLTNAYLAANPRTSKGIAGGGGIRLDPLQRLQPEMFGARADSKISNLNVLSVQGTDNADAIDAMLRFNELNILDTEWPFVPTIWWGPGVYYTSRTSQPWGACHWVGQQASAYTGTVIRYPANTVGVLVNNRNCVRDGGGFGGPFVSAAGSIFEGINFQGGGISGDKSKHGFWGRAQATVIGCTISNFPGMPIAWIGTRDVNDSTYGTPNCFYTARNILFGCGGLAGYYTFGSDANDGTSVGDIVKDSLFAGFMDMSALGNTYVNPSVQGSGQVAPAGQSSGRCWYAGYQWHLTSRVSTGVAPIVAPNQPWVRVDPQAAPSAYWPQYDPAKTYYFSGGIYVGSGAGNQTNIFGNYTESLIVSTHESGAVIFGSNAFATKGSNCIQADSGDLVGSNGIGSKQRWTALAAPQMAFLGAYSRARVGVTDGGTYSHFRHYDEMEDRDYSYHPDGNGDHVYANGTPGSGEMSIYLVSGRYTTRKYGGATAQPHVFTPLRFALSDPDRPNGDGDRRMQMGSQPPGGSGWPERMVVWNNGLDNSNAAVDYWLRKNGAWVARP